MANNNGPMWKNEQDRQILAEVYRSFATAFDGNNNPTAYQSWFRGAGIVENHPMKMLRKSIKWKGLLTMMYLTSPLLECKKAKATVLCRIREFMYMILHSHLRLYIYLMMGMRLSR